ncbi:histidine phosphatase family protein [Clostridium fungisolvens]|uniref:Phosphoserine phosphatase 2 n=1 Tax=Clostridium fungisolvens TaxID=1604897 RepID=A0A6V8SHA6_9CLOT|nr:histidine phosphatase family protein [Clostridium fungisolvens]GFP76589.1 Putative phosphoserine phosphatase 2 [Clostridium fungisolvens]
MKNIITIQHTQSIHHTNGMVGSWTDWDLSDLGKKQADRIGRKLIGELQGKEYVMYSSDLLRAKNTAKIVSEHLGITPIFTEALRERNLGAAVGKSVQWLRGNIQCKEKTVDDRMLHDAESRRDVWNRLLDFYKSILTDNHENIIIVSHGDTLSVFNAMWLGLDIEMLNKCDLFGMAGGVSFMNENQDGKHIIRRLSDMSYLE